MSAALSQIKTFQFTPLREGRLTASAGRTTGKVFQFTPLREGRPKEGKEMSGFVISIHAPPRGATEKVDANVTTSELFQFTPLREGRPVGGFYFVPPSYFNSRPSARGDREERGSGNRQDISIHAPPRGATQASYAASQEASISIHAPPRGATAKDMQFLQIFCSTLTNQHGLTIVPRNLSRLFW